MKQETTQPCSGRRGERGAALVTALLISLLMLGAGGALIYTTGMSVVNAVDSTAEVQAYYAAEAGLQSALSVARGNVAAQAGLNLPAGTKAKNNFRVLNLKSTSNLPGDASAQARLSGWLPYTGGRVSLGNNLNFEIEVTDPDDVDRNKITNDANYIPSRLLITSKGYGPKGSMKQMQLMLRPSLGLDIPGGVTLRGKTAGGAGNMTFALGNSENRGFNTDGSKPVFVTTGNGDAATVTAAVAADGKAEFDNPTMGNTAAGTAQMPAFLESPAACEALIAELKAMDKPNDNIKIVEGEGEYNTNKDDTGGILLVTGSLKLGGNSNFTGIILVLGGGKVEWKGQGDFTGAMFVAKYDRETLTDFDAPYFDFDGAGSSQLTFSASAAQNELTKLGFRLGGIVEN